MNTKLENNLKKYLNTIIYLWFIAVSVTAVCNFILFTSPYWFGINSSNINMSLNGNKIKIYEDANNHLYSTKYLKIGSFGLYKYCVRMSILNTKQLNITNSIKTDSSFIKCIGEWNRLDTFSVYFSISTCLIGFSCILGCVCVTVCFTIIFFINKMPQLVLYISSFIQIAIGLLVLAACLIYPFGWSDTKVKDLCQSECYFKGNCELNWTFILALIQSIISIILSIFVYLMASSTRLFPDNKGHFNKLKSLITIKRSIDEIKSNKSIELKSNRNYGFSFNLNY